MPNKSTPMD